jgi:RNA polymerase sigma-70 factor (ECF subfamily)
VAGYLAGRGAGDPEGLTSDVFVAVLPRLAGLSGGVAGLRTFVFSVAHARAVDDLRRRTRRPAPVTLDGPGAAPVEPRPAESAEDAALDHLGTEGVLRLLRGLPPDYRDVLALRVVADLDLEQTATVMGRSVGSIKQLQRRALVALRSELAARGVTSARAAAMTETS